MNRHKPACLLHLPPKCRGFSLPPSHPLSLSHTELLSSMNHCMSVLLGIVENVQETSSDTGMHNGTVTVLHEQ